MTIRRLADEIEYSQPVLYSHFKNRDAIVAAVVVEGFRELAAALRQAADDRRGAVFDAGMAYLGFARDNAALYEAMFSMPIDLHFAEADTRLELREAGGEARFALPLFSKLTLLLAVQLGDLPDTMLLGKFPLFSWSVISR